MFFLGILFLTNTIESNIITAKSGRIIQVGNSGTVGVDVDNLMESGTAGTSDDQGLGKAGTASDTLGLLIRG